MNSYYLGNPFYLTSYLVLLILNILRCGSRYVYALSYSIVQHRKLAEHDRMELHRKETFDFKLFAVFSFILFSLGYPFVLSRHTMAMGFCSFLFFSEVDFYIFVCMTNRIIRPLLTKPQNRNRKEGCRSWEITLFLFAGCCCLCYCTFVIGICTQYGRRIQTNFMDNLLVQL